MARTAVLIFLLDSLPEFPKILNQTLQETSPNLATGLNFTIQECNPNIASYVLQKADFERGRIKSNWKLYKTIEDHVAIRKLPADSAYNEDNVFDNSIQSSDENIDNVQHIFNHNDMHDSLIQNVQENSNFTKSIVRQSPPFLVAIFETMSNVTAQTCAGSLLSAHWVVTAASCLGVLSDFYGNRTNHTDNSRYTIVVGSTNPLVDGSIFNVTETLFHPTKYDEHPANSSRDDSYRPVLVMMRISPGLVVGKMEILEVTENNLCAVVHGWNIAVNDSYHDTMLPAALNATLTNSSECHPTASDVKSTTALCFKPDLSKSSNSTKLGVGGPVVVHNRILGVVVDDRVPLIVEPIAAHRWIQLLLNTNF